MSWSLYTPITLFYYHSLVLYLLSRPEISRRGKAGNAEIPGPTFLRELTPSIYIIVTQLVSPRHGSHGARKKQKQTNKQNKQDHRKQVGVNFFLNKRKLLSSIIYLFTFSDKFLRVHTLVEFCQTIRSSYRVTTDKPISICGCVVHVEEDTTFF